MAINKANLKKMLMPVVRECIKETLSDKTLLHEIVLSSGVLSNIVKEVAEGLSHTQQPINDSDNLRYAAHLNASKNRVSPAVQEARESRERSRNQFSKLPVTPRKSKPSTEFEKTQSQVDSSYNASASKHGALAGSDPSDSGVNLTAFGLPGAVNESRRPETNDAGVDLSELMIGRRR